MLTIKNISNFIFDKSNENKIYQIFDIWKNNEKSKTFSKDSKDRSLKNNSYIALNKYARIDKLLMHFYILFWNKGIKYHWLNYDKSYIFNDYFVTNKKSLFEYTNDDSNRKRAIKKLDDIIKRR